MRAVALCLLLSAAPQGGPAIPRPAPPVTTIEPEALELWQRTCRSTFLRDPDTTKPVTAFDLQLDVRTRGKTGSNDLHPRLLWLAPSFLRFEMSRGREEARGPDGYWLREDDEIVRLDGRDSAEDRRQIEELLVIVHNFVAWTQPSKLEIQGLQRLANPPSEIRRHPVLAARDLTQRLEWIQLDTPGLLLHATAAVAASARRVKLGVDRASALPILALVSDDASGAPPMLFHFDDHRPLDDLRVPGSIFVYGFEGRGDGWTLAAEPSHEMYVQAGTLRATHGPEDFRAPKKP